MSLAADIPYTSLYYSVLTAADTLEKLAPKFLATDSWTSESLRRAAVKVRAAEEEAFKERHEMYLRLTNLLKSFDEMPAEYREYLDRAEYLINVGWSDTR